MRKSIARRDVTLRAFLDASRSSLDVRLDIAKRLLTVVARMHERARVHGRLGLDTVRLSGVRSFRVDVSLDDDPPSSGTRDKRFTPPEGEPSLRGDVFALGTILSELLGAELPSSLAAITRVMTDPDPMARYASAQVAMNALSRVAP